MKNKLEAYLHLATALVAGATPFFLDPVIIGLMLAAISLAQAANVWIWENRVSQGGE